MSENAREDGKPEVRTKLRWLSLFARYFLSSLELSEGGGNNPCLPANKSHPINSLKANLIEVASRHDPGSIVFSLGMFAFSCVRARGVQP
jgi:hypothetical protein